MTRPRYSIVVPTRHRPHTLPHTLATILVQQHDSFEVVVADNASGPETRQAVEACGDDRIRFLRSGQPLSMSANWERALAACRGEWITFIGDDDGLMPTALPECDDLIAAHAVRSIRPQYAVYVWPCADATGEGGRLQLHLGREVRRGDAREALAAMTIRPNAAPIPLPYHGWVHRSLYEEAARSGAVFQGKDPDTYAGILLAALSDEFVTQDRPLSLIGISGTSNTFRFVVAGQPGASTRDSDALHAAEGIVRHPLAPEIPTVTAALIDGLLQIRDRLGADAIRWQPTPLEIALHAAASVWRADAEGDAQLARVRGMLSSWRDRRAYDAAVATAPPSGRPPRMTCVDRGRNGPFLVIDTRPLGVQHVAGAATAAAAALETSVLVGLDAYAVGPPPPPPAPPPETAVPRRPHLFKRLERDVRHAVRGWWRAAHGTPRPQEASG